MYRRARLWLGNLFRRLAFDNRRFWDARYDRDPQVGSGPGSRNEHLLLKNGVVRETIEEYDIKSIVDIGCGDIAILRDIHVEDYVGIDLSSIVVAKNKNLKRNWTFLCRDLTRGYTPPNADLILCLDVLIHQKSRSNYRTILGKAIAATRKVALISGYSRPALGWNVFFHEPLATSIQKICPAAHIQKIAEYRETDLLRVLMPSVPVEAAATPSHEASDTM